MAPHRIAVLLTQAGVMRRTDPAYIDVLHSVTCYTAVERYNTPKLTWDDPCEVE